MLKEFFYAFVISFLISLVLAPLIIRLCKKLKMGQTVLKYVKEHEGKSGTPTMGGLIIIFGVILSSILFFKKDFSLAITSIVVMFAYGTLGFLDDFIKIRFKQNLGLRPYQKIIGQVAISTLIGIFVYKSPYLGGSIILPFTDIALNLGWGIIPFIVLIYVAFVNSVNLIDGLDGLCSSVSFIYTLCFVACAFICTTIFNITGQALVEQQTLFITSICLVGALLAFKIFNVFPAKIFMGDTGSLAIGGFLTSLAVFTRLELLVIVIGFMFVLTSISDIIQVLYYKKTKKRIFKMAPLHHHYQMKGVHENRIVYVYSIITLFLGLISIFLTYIV